MKLIGLKLYLLILFPQEIDCLLAFMLVKGVALAEVAKDAISPRRKPDICIAEYYKQLVIDNSSYDPSPLRFF